MVKLRVLDLKHQNSQCSGSTLVSLLVYVGLPFKIFSNYTRNGRNSQNLFYQMNIVKDGSDDWYRLNFEQEVQR